MRWTKRITMQDLNLDTTQATHLEIQVYYSLGGMNYFTYKQEERGFYASVTPVTIEGPIVSYTAFSGIKQFLLPVKRKSEKALNSAIKLLTPELEKTLVDHVLNKMELKRDRYSIEREIGISLPPRYEGLTLAQIQALPVQVVQKFETSVYPNLEAAKQVHNLNAFCGAMYGVVDGKDALRFESQEAYNILSR